MPTGIYRRVPIIKAGDKFNKLTAVKFIEKRGKSQQYWLFKCECGNEKIIKVGAVKTDDTKSCGCLKKPHGMTSTRIFKSWQAMRNRCLNPNATGYKDYGGRGITICKEWIENFQNFFEDMGIRPEGMTLDRENNNLGYCKSNCRWATPKQQANNRRNNLT